ncbi:MULTISPECIES: metal-dependent hydrolase [Halorussus]|uniref:metal-dependent hydrolase n=1 Tax=Halorussus TaxID=1070314 RepID=UPI000E219071|nr:MULTISPECIES: metal-dependent hydrolase [Halorussus]NHN61275.1 metal-dependent hydrolase [Halorussus sp. JP-T4]
MMATTHALFGVVLASAAAAVAPEFAPVALVAGVVGSVFPDLDLYAGHRRTLHFPVYYAVAALPAIALAVAVPATATVALAVFLAGAAAHSLMDVLGGGLELKPWRAESERAVYDHYRGRWVPPRRWVRYDGAPEDFLVAAAFGAPALLTYDGHVQAFVAAVLAVSAGYVLARKRLASLAERLVPHAPAALDPHIPERFRDGGDPAPRGEMGD